MKRVVDVLYGLKGYPNAARFTDFKTDLFANGDTPGIVMDTAVAIGISVTGVTTTAFSNSGATTTAFSNSGACTTGVSLSGTATTQVSITGTCTTGIDIDESAATTTAIAIGSSISAGMPMSSTKQGLIRAFGQIAASEVLTADIRGIWARVRVDAGCDMTGGYQICGVQGSTKMYGVSGDTTTALWMHSGVYGSFESDSEEYCSVLSGGNIAGVVGILGLGAGFTIDTGGIAAAVQALSNCNAAMTATGTFAGVYIGTAYGASSPLVFTTGVYIANSTCTTGISIGTCTTGISVAGAALSVGIDFVAGSVTTGTLIDYVGISGKVSGYLFNGTMTTSTLTGTTIVDDFSCTCAHDGLSNDTLRMFRRIWTGTMPNGSAAADFILAEFAWNGTYGDGGAESEGGDPTILTLSSTTTFNDLSANFRALDIDISGITLTSVALVYGIDITGKTGVDAGINITTATAGIRIAGTITNGIDVTAAASMTNLLKFDAVAGVLVASDVDPTETPSDGGLGADGVITILIGDDTCYIPYFTALHDM